MKQYWEVVYGDQNTVDSLWKYLWLKLLLICADLTLRAGALVCVPKHMHIFRLAVAQEVDRVY